MKTLLVPTGFYITSKNAIAYATTLCRALNAKLTLLHAYQSFPSGLLLSEQRKREELELVRKEAETKLKKMCSEIEPAQHCRCDFINDEGPVKEVILKHVKLVKPELLIMGTENLGPMDTVLFGSVTEKVIKEVDTAMLIVPESPAFKPPKKIAFASDYHDSDIEEIRFLASLAEALHARLSIVHIVEDDEDIEFEQRYFEEFQEEVALTMPDPKIDFALLQGNKISKALEQYVAEEDIDVLAVAKTQKNMIERLFVGSVSNELFNQMYMPLLIFQARDEPGNIFGA